MFCRYLFSLICVLFIFTYLFCRYLKIEIRFKIKRYNKIHKTYKIYNVKKYFFV